MNEGSENSEERDIEKVLWFRNDISPFLVHLTRDTVKGQARDNLISILYSNTITYQDNKVSHASYGYPYGELTPEIVKTYFSAVCFTETPLNEIHTLLEISKRRVDLTPYGLVFVKDKCKEKGVSPVLYFNNNLGDKGLIMEALCSLIRTKDHDTAARKILPYIAIFGKLLEPVNGHPPDGDIDFLWEREWRYISEEHSFGFDENDVFIGLCPHGDINNFEKMFPPIKFIDPKRNVKWYADKLVDAKKRLDLKYGVV